VRRLALTALILTCTVTPSVAAEAPDLAFEERVSAQAAIDRFWGRPLTTNVVERRALHHRLEHRKSGPCGLLSVDNSALAQK